MCMVEMAIFNIQRIITLKVGKQELRFMCSACHLMVINICVKFHENMSSGFKVMELTQKMLTDTHTHTKRKLYTPFEEYGNCISDKLKDFIKNKLPQDVRYHIPLLTLTFVRRQLQSLDTSKATGLDELSAKFLKKSTDIIAEPLTKIFNLSISTGIFPENFKKAKDIPGFKKGEKSDKSNYRPISVLSLLSKIIEKHVAQQLKSYLNMYDLSVRF